MTVNICIGHAEISPRDQDDLDDEMNIAVGVIERDDEVPFSLGIWESNRLDYNYSFLENFCREVGILDIFFCVYVNDDGSENHVELYGYPGVIWVSDNTLRSFKNALNGYQAKYPDIKIQDEITSDTVKVYLHILTWLVYWSERALRDAKRPGIEIS